MIYFHTDTEGPTNKYNSTKDWNKVVFIKKRHWNSKRKITKEEVKSYLNQLKKNNNKKQITDNWATLAQEDKSSQVAFGKKEKKTYQNLFPLTKLYKNEFLYK